MTFSVATPSAMGSEYVKLKKTGTYYGIFIAYRVRGGIQIQYKEVSMTFAKMFVVCSIAVFALGVTPGIIQAEEFKIAVLRIDKTNAQAYKPLAEHLAKRGVSVRLVEVPTHDSVTKMFSEGQVDAMFSGSGIPGSMFTIHRLKLKQSLTGFRPKESNIQRAMVSN